MEDSEVKVHASERHKPTRPPDQVDFDSPGRGPKVPPISSTNVTSIKL